MKLLISRKQLDSEKCRALIPLECQECGHTHYRTKNIILRVLNGSFKKTQQASFCSKKCYYSNAEKRQSRICQQCGKPTIRKMSEISKNTFCSHSCSASYNNTHKTTGTRRSKLECWIEHQLETYYPNLKISYNKTDAINAELDIFIPSLKLAFELNGIFHYEPIYGPEKLLKTQTNDNRKFQACLEKNIELCILDTSSQKYFKEKTSMRYLDIITKIIDEKVFNGAPRTI